MDSRPAALVTGSARRVGRHVAEALVARGFDVVVHATDGERSAKTAREIGAAGSVGADLRDVDAPAALVEAALELLGGRLDVLVNNAGTFVRKSLAESTPQDWAEAFDVCARAPFFLMQAAAPHLARTRGLIVNVSDHAAHEHWTSHPAHSAAKAALESLTLSAAKALAPEVRVNAVAPGPILAPDDSPPELIERLARRGTGWGSPEDLVAAIDALLAEPRRTGEVIVL